LLFLCEILQHPHPASNIDPAKWLQRCANIQHYWHYRWL